MCVSDGYLFPGDAHVISHVGENGGFNEEALAPQSLAPALQPGPFSHTTLDQLQDLVVLLFVNLKRRGGGGGSLAPLASDSGPAFPSALPLWVSPCRLLRVGLQTQAAHPPPTNLWPLLGGGVKGAPHNSPLGPFHAPPDELIVDGLLHVDAGASRAALALVEKDPLVGLLHRLLHCKTRVTPEASPSTPCLALQGGDAGLGGLKDQSILWLEVGSLSTGQSSRWFPESGQS